MSSNPLMDPSVRDHFLADPESLLGDSDIMRALIAARDAARGENVIDLRAVAMERLNERLDRLEETHRTVLAAAYENLAAMNMIHRAILRLLDAADIAGFLDDLAGPVSDALRLDSVRLMLDDGARAAALAGLSGLVSCAAPDAKVGQPRRVTLRQVDPGSTDPDGPEIRSEACLRLDLGPELATGLLILGARDPSQFAPGQGTDLLSFLAEVFERALRRHLE